MKLTGFQLVKKFDATRKQNALQQITEVNRKTSRQEAEGTWGDH
jgi:hypothetical protein